jgi:hypothetical protein
MTFLISWLSMLCFSKFRGIRHTATVSIVSIAQAIGEILGKEI